MKYSVVMYLKDGTMKTLWEGNDWATCKEKFNFWANEYRDEMDSIAIEVS